MAIFRCAACGSPNVMRDTETGGIKYNYVKGAVGTVLLGAGGAAAGIQSKSEAVYKCPDCGMTLTYPMPSEIQILIEAGVISPEARKNLVLRGVPIDWEYLTGKYKNIEKSDFDIPSNNPQPFSQTIETTIQDNTTIDESSVVSFENKKLYEEACFQYAENCEKWKIEIEQITELREKKINEELNRTVQKRKNTLAKEKEEAIQRYTKLKEEYTAQKTQVEEQLSSLGFFKVLEKRNAKNEIERLTRAIQEQTSALTASQTEYTTKMNEIETVKGKWKESIRKEVNEKFPIPLKPAKPDAMVNYKANGAKCSAEEWMNFYMQDKIFRFVEKNGRSSYDEIVKGCDDLAELSDRRIKSFIQALIDTRELKEELGNYVVVHGKSRAKAEAEVKSVLKSPEEFRIYETFVKNANKELSVTQIIEATELPESYPVAKVSKCIMELRKAGFIERLEINRKAYFRII